MIRRYSELLDPTLLEEQQVRSPSGHLLSGSTYALRDDRPLSVRERQERIRQQIKLQHQQSVNNVRSQVNANGRSDGPQPHAKEKHRGCLGCFGGT